jgi:hypothetical protein
MLVIEGPDNVGKTTLAREVCRVMGAHYAHMTRPTEDFDFFQGYKEIIRRNYLERDVPVVQDRFHFGGIAYHRDVLTIPRLEIVSSWVRALGGLIVLVHASNIEAYVRHLRTNPKDEMFDEHALTQAAIRFNTLVPYADICIDVTVPHSEQIVFCGAIGLGQIVSKWRMRLDALS